MMAGKLWESWSKVIGFQVRGDTNRGKEMQASLEPYTKVRFQVMRNESGDSKEVFQTSLSYKFNNPHQAKSSTKTL